MGGWGGGWGGGGSAAVKAVLQIFCSPGCSYIVERGGKLQNDKTGGEKKTQVRLFFMYMPHINFKSLA